MNIFGAIRSYFTSRNEADTSVFRCQYCGKVKSIDDGTPTLWSGYQEFECPTCMDCAQFHCDMDVDSGVFVLKPCHRIPVVPHKSSLCQSLCL